LTDIVVPSVVYWKLFPTNIRSRLGVSDFDVFIGRSFFTRFRTLSFPLTTQKQGWRRKERRDVVLSPQTRRTLVHTKDNTKNCKWQEKSPCNLLLQVPLPLTTCPDSFLALASGSIDVNEFTSSRSFEITALQTAMRQSKLSLTVISTDN
jgi:hypothetical protein